ncbi:MAG: hypothetical protein COB49_06825 [Alphaproteobacteria bacterium]|nr:MAG: hypothetical protein COB49_06825 [Alphaproteobacteria bacterium]
MKYSASMKFLWADLPLPDRARKAKENGFDSIELWDWRSEDMAALQDACDESDIYISGFFGHSSGGFRDPSMRRELLDNLAESVEVAVRHGADQLHMFSDGIRRPQGEIMKPPPITRIEQYISCVEGVKEAVKLVEGKNITLILEAINTVHVPGYFWEDAAITVEMCRAVDHPQVQMSFDCFHQQLVAGRITENLIASLPYTGRVDVANVPGRHQPDVGEIDYSYILKVLEQHNYNGMITFETDPLNGDNEACVKAIRSIFKF